MCVCTYACNNLSIIIHRSLFWKELSGLNGKTYDKLEIGDFICEDREMKFLLSLSGQKGGHSVYLRKNEMQCLKKGWRRCPRELNLHETMGLTRNCFKMLRFWEVLL